MLLRCVVLLTRAISGGSSGVPGVVRWVKWGSETGSCIEHALIL